MTLDKREHKKTNKETEKAKRKTDSSTASVKEKCETDALPTKIVMRRLPPRWTEETLLEQIAPVPQNDYFCFVPADLSLGQHAFSHCYINFANQQDIAIFMEKFDGYVFLDDRGNEFPACVEFAAFSKVPKKRLKKPDPRKGTIETDADYLKFLEQLQNTEHQVIPAPEVFLEEIEAREKQLKENQPVTTPLIEYMIRRREEKRLAIVQAREEKRKKELERRKREEEQRRRERERQREKERQKLREKEEREKKQATKAEEAPAAAPVKLLKNPEREKEQKEKEKLSREETKSNVREQDTDRQISTARDRQSDKSRDTSSRQSDVRVIAQRQSKTSTEGTGDSGTVGEGSCDKSSTSSRQRTSHQRPSYKDQYYDADEKRPTVLTNKRSDASRDSAERVTIKAHDKEYNKEREGSKPKELTDVAHVGSKSEGKKPLPKESTETSRDYRNTGRDRREFRNRKDDVRDQRSAREQRDPRDDPDHRVRGKTQSDAPDSSHSHTSAKGQKEESDESRQSVRSAKTDKSSSEKTSRSYGRTSDRRGSLELSEGDGSTKDGAAGESSSTTESSQKQQHGSSRQRIRYKDRPERAIYNPARRAVERQKDGSQPASAATASEENEPDK